MEKTHHVMKQKFRRYSFVRINEDKSSRNHHYYDGCDAIVIGTYSQKFGGTDTKSYELAIVKNNKVVNLIAWYQESDLTLLANQDRDKAEEMVETFNLREG